MITQVRHHTPSPDRVIIARECTETPFPYLGCIRGTATPQPTPTAQHHPTTLADPATTRTTPPAPTSPTTPTPTPTATPAAIPTPHGGRR